MKTIKEIESKIKAINKLILKCEMDAEHSCIDTKKELYCEIDTYQIEVDLLKWVLSDK